MGVIGEVFIWMCVCERERVCARVCVCVWESESVCLCKCVCVCVCAVFTSLLLSHLEFEQEVFLDRQQSETKQSKVSSDWETHTHKHTKWAVSDIYTHLAISERPSLPSPFRSNILSCTERNKMVKIVCLSICLSVCRRLATHNGLCVLIELLVIVMSVGLFQQVWQEALRKTHPVT